MNYALIIAGGSGNRMGQDIPKQFMLGNGTAVVCQPVLHYQAEMDIPWRKQWSGVDPQWYLWLERGGMR